MSQGLQFSLFHNVRSRTRSMLPEVCKLDTTHCPSLEQGVRIFTWCHCHEFRQDKKPGGLCTHSFQWLFFPSDVMIRLNKNLSLTFCKRNDWTLILMVSKILHSGFSVWPTHFTLCTSIAHNTTGTETKHSDVSGVSNSMVKYPYLTTGFSILPSCRHYLRVFSTLKGKKKKKPTYWNFRSAISSLS